MLDLIRKAASTSNIIRVMLRNSSTQQGITGLYGNSTNLIISTIADVEATATAYAVNSSKVEAVTVLGTYSAPTATKCRFSEVDATNHPGLYELQLADARFAVANAKSLHITFSGATNLLTADVTIQLTKFDPDDAVRAGLTALPNANAAAANGLLINGNNGSSEVILGLLTVSGEFTVGAFPIGSGGWTVNGVNEAASIAAIKAVTDVFTFTGGLVKADTVDWKGSTAPAMTGDAYARLGAPTGASIAADIAAVAAGPVILPTTPPNGYGSVTVTPLGVTSVQNKVATRDIDLIQYGTETYTWIITDASGNAVDLSGKTVRLVLYTTDGTSPVVGVAQYDSPAALTISGTSHNNVTRTFSTTDSGTKRALHYLLWNQTDGIPLVRGTIRVVPALRTYP